jgi:hypothetical protein
MCCNERFHNLPGPVTWPEAVAYCAVDVRARVSHLSIAMGSRSGRPQGKRLCSANEYCQNGAGQVGWAGSSRTIFHTMRTASGGWLAARRSVGPCC